MVDMKMSKHRMAVNLDAFVILRPPLYTHVRPVLDCMGEVGFSYMAVVAARANVVGGGFVSSWC